MRVAFFIDGFNVYYSVVNAIRARSITGGKWLDYYSLCETFRRDVPDLGSAYSLASVNYYSALATHLPDHTKVLRHKALVEALEHRGVNVQLGRFRYKGMKRCNNCHVSWPTHEEKETDINLALGLFKCFALDEADTAVVLSADTDMISVVREARSFFPERKSLLVFPTGRTVTI